MSVESEAFLAHVKTEGDKVRAHLEDAFTAILNSPCNSNGLDIDFNEERRNGNGTIQQE